MPLRWFAILVGLFLLAAGVDAYFSHAKKSGAAAAASENVSVKIFMTAVQSGELTGGRVIYRTNAGGLADVTATRKKGDADSTVRTTARITDQDLATLREHQFTEDDAASFAANRSISAGERAADIAHGLMQPLGILVFLAAIVVVVQRFAGRFSAFSAQRLRPATSGVKFSSVAGCDEAKAEVDEVVEFLKYPARFRETG